MSRFYTVKFDYKLLTLSVEQKYNSNQHTLSFWKSKAPSKIISFVWSSQVQTSSQTRAKMDINVVIFPPKL
ncbi:hypothetical protein Lal_00001689 [Lupinus albus]|nr:hypothetical protein Lal_00001689 [Lupinus albus]